jgi:nickel-type superoxide dismutase maturation protease
VEIDYSPAHRRRLPWGVVVVAGRSMAPTLRPGDFLLVRYGGRPARPGDVVLARRPDRAELLVIKRLRQRLSDGRLWLAGDNPSHSDDSRLFGAVAPEAVLARVLLRYWPPVRCPTAASWAMRP